MVQVMTGRILITSSLKYCIQLSQCISQRYTLARNSSIYYRFTQIILPLIRFQKVKLQCKVYSGISFFAATVIQFVEMAANSSSTLADILQNADQLFDENQFQEVLDVLNKFEDQSLADIKWRQARAMFKLSKVDKNKKDELIRSGYELTKAALEANENDYAIHKWMAILLDAKSELDGVKERITQLTNVKKHMERAVELNPADPTSWHLLGNFAFGLADMPWYQRKIVSAIFATPPTGTYEEALEHFLKAEETKPNFYSMNLLFIGKCYQRLKNVEQAKHYLTLAANVRVLNEDDKNCKEEATVLLKNY